MPKNQFINPEEVRKPQQLEFKPVPVNQYNKSIEEEKENFSKNDFIRIYPRYGSNPRVRNHVEPD
jgi:2-oxoisovalerate dehydrogenase E1 component